MLSRPLSQALLTVVLLVTSATNSLASFNIGDRVQANGGYIIRSSAAGPTTGYSTVSGTLGSTSCWLFSTPPDK